MTYTCHWPCVSETAPSVSAMVQSAAPMSFVAALAGSQALEDRPYPSPCIKGDALSIKICQEEYRKRVEDCKNALRARLTLNKGDKPYSARDVRNKVGNLWKTTTGWKMVPLGRGYYDFIFDSAEDFKKIWVVGTINLKPGLLRFSQWTKRLQVSDTKADSCIALDSVGGASTRVLA